MVSGREKERDEDRDLRGLRGFREGGGCESSWLAERPPIALSVGLGWTILFFCACVFLCVSYGAWDMPLLRDNQHYYFISERFASGVPPHVAQFDPKNALSMILSGIAIWVGRLVGAPDVGACRVASIFVTAGSVALLWRLTFELTRRKGASHLAAIAMMGFAGFLEIGTMGARPKIFLVFFVLLALFAVARRRPFLAGFAAGLSFLCWQMGILALFGIAVATSIGRDRRGGLIRLFAGAAAPVLLYQVYFVFSGALGDQLFQSYEFPARFMSQDSDNPFGLIESLSFRWSAGFGAYNATPALLGIGLLELWFVAVTRPRAVWAFLVREPGWASLVATGHIVIIFTIVEHQGYPDLFFALPFVAICIGIWVASLWLRGGTRGLIRVRIGLAGVLCLGLLVLVGLGIGKFEHRFGLKEQVELSRKVRAILDQGKTLHVVGATHLLGLAHENNHTPIGFLFRGIRGYLESEGLGAPYRVRIGDEGPDFLLVGRTQVRYLDLFAPAYIQIADREFQDQDISFWKRAAPP